MAYLFQSNLLINENGEVCLSDFGLSKKIRDGLEPPSGRSTSTFNMSLRWYALNLWSQKCVTHSVGYKVGSRSP
jgi:serine/threonine protein kinase